MNRISSKTTLLFSMLALSSPAVYCGTMGEAMHSPMQVYVGVFGGGGAASDVEVSQFGTAFYFENAGGPLAVNAFGNMDTSSTWLVGGHIGYKWPEFMGNFSSNWHLVPAVELEGYYLGNTTLEGDDINNETHRLPEHDFHSKYPLKTGVFLANMVLSSNTTALGNFHPYVGVGFGSAIVHVSNAIAAQVSPPEPGLNHFNSDPNDTALAFAAQPKIGLEYTINPMASVFVEYRFLYLSRTSYTFGSTVYPGHPVTSNWRVKMDDQTYNFGTIGINLDL